MAIHLPRTKRDLTLLSTSELMRLLSIPESRMAKAVREGVVRPLGSVGRVALIALNDDEIDDLRRMLCDPEKA